MCANAGFSPHVGFETEDYVAVLGLVAEGLGDLAVQGVGAEAADEDEYAGVGHGGAPTGSRTVIR